MQRPRRGATTALLLAGALAASGCEGILDVDLPGDIAESALTAPGLASTLVLSAQSDFECGFSNYILSLSIWGDEMIDASTWGPIGTWQTRRGEVDGGGGTCAEQIFRGNGSFSVYLQMQIARNQAINAFDIISQHDVAQVPNKELLLAKAALYEGYATIMLSAFCEVRLDPEAAPTTQTAGFQRAEARFGEAMTRAQAAGGAAGDSILNAARVGRARALINIGQHAAARPFAAAVPTAFRYNATYAASPVRRTNWVFAYNHQNLMVSVDPRYRNLTVNGVADPRVPVQNRTGVSSPNDGTTPIWWQLLYTSASAPIPLATGREAQLIVAEAALAANDPAAAVAAIDAIRASYTPAIASYATDPGGAITVDNVRAQLLEERRRTLYLQSHRVYDMQRLDIPLNSGTDSKGRAYTVTPHCLPFPLDDTATL